ncbi:hypothetical protein ACWCXX_09305 [Streptomyces sp. NPDC001732]
MSPSIAFAGLAVPTVLATLHFDLLTGRTATVGTALPVVLAAGLVVALRIRRADPERSARLTEVDVERDRAPAVPRGSGTGPVRASTPH